MFKSTNHKLALYVSVLLVLSLFTQVLPRQAITIANAAPKTESASPVNEVGMPQPEPAPTVAPDAAVIVATLTDNITAATKVVPGGTINYTATITNNGAASPADDATNLNFSAPLDANTTLVAGSVHASPIAFNDTYNWVGNTFLDTSARALPTVTSNDVAVNAPAGTDTFTLTAIAGGATALGGVVTLASPSGHFTYTPPLGRPNAVDGATVQDSFTYTITNSADPSLTSTGTVKINLTGRVWYLQAGAAGDGRSNTPSSSPSAMSTAADKSTDIFYMFSNAGSLSGLFTVDAGQQLLGQGTALVVNTITLFSLQAPTPTLTNGAGNCVTLAGAPGNNTVSGFNIGNCTGGTAIAGSNVGTLTINTLQINTTGAGLDLTGVGTPTVNIVLGGIISSGGTKNVNLVGLNGTINLASGILSGATGNAFDVNGGAATIAYIGSTSNSGAKQVNIANMTGGSASFGAVSGTGTGINLTTNTGATIGFTGGISLSTGANAAFTATGGGTVDATQNNTSIVNTLTTTTGTALNVANTTIGASGLTFRSITSNGAGNANGIILDTTGSAAGLTVSGNGGTCTSSATCTGGTISSKSGADGSTTQGSGIFLNSTSGVSIDRMQMNDFQNFGIKGANVTGFSFTNSRIVGLNGTTEAGGGEEGPIRFDNLFTSGAFPTATINGSTIQGAFSVNIRVTNAGGTLNRLVIDNCTLPSMNSSTAPGNGGSSILFDVGAAATGGTLNFTISNSTISGARSHGLSFTAHGGAHMDAVVTQNKVQNADTHILSAASNLLLQGGDLGVADITYNISCNKFSTSAAGGGKGAGVILFKATNTTSGSMIGTFSGNAIGVVGQAFSGAPNSAPGLWVQDHGAGTFTTLIQNNTIVEYGEEAIDLQRTSGSSTMNASVFGNTVTPHSPDGFCGLNIEQGAVAADTGTMNLVVGNSNAGSGQQNDFSAGDASNFSDIQVLRAGASTTVLNLSRNGSASGTVAQVLKDDNVNGAATTVFVPTGGSMNLVAGLPATPPAIGACSLPPIPNPVDDSARNRTDEVLGGYLSASTMAQAKAELATTPVTSTPAAPVVADGTPAGPSYRAALGSVVHHALSTLAGVAHKLDSAITPTAYAESDRGTSPRVSNPDMSGLPDGRANAPSSGEVVTLNTIATFPAGGKSITIKYSVTVNSPPLVRSVTTQGTVTANGGGISVQTDDPEPAGAADPTVTLVNTLMTWNGGTSIDWNTATNWTPPAGGTQYAPGVSNPAVNDVVIPVAGAQPNISATDIGVYSLNISNGRTLTITSPRILTIGGSPGGDLTLDGIISGGELRFGTGTHSITNAGGTGSLSSTNVATVLSGGTVTLSQNLQAGALAINAGGSMNISNRTLSLNGNSPTLVVAGSLTAAGSTVVFNGTGAQTSNNTTAFDNLTINNTGGSVTLGSNAVVNLVLNLMSDLNTSSFTLIMPDTGTSTGTADVVGNVMRTGVTAGGGANNLSYGNPFNTIKITAGVTPGSITVNLVKSVPTGSIGFPTAVQRTYTITPSGGSGIVATLRLHYLPGELNSNDPTLLNLWRFDSGLNRWRPNAATSRDCAAGCTTNTSSFWVEKTGVTQFSPWTLNSTNSPSASNSSISGHITDANGDPLGGVVVGLSNGRRTITRADGNYLFTEVPTGDFYTLTPMLANHSFTPHTRSFSLLGNMTDAAFAGAADGTETANPLDTDMYFVRQQYLDFLGREPDEPGLQFWTNQISGCLENTECIHNRRIDVSAQFFIAQEFQLSGSYIYDLYQGSLGRRPMFTEYLTDRPQVIGGSDLDTQKATFAGLFVQRPEFVTKYQGATTAETFVDALLQTAQQSGVDLSSQRAGLVATYNGGTDMTNSRALVVRAIADDGVFRQSQYNKAFVLMEYFDYLQRDIDQNGYNFWLDVLNQGAANNYRGMVCSFLTSAEYQRRFSSVVSHGNGECGQ